MGSSVLVLSAFCFLITYAGAVTVRCFSGIDTMTGICTDLIGDGIDEDDCCLNINYCFETQQNGSSNSCRRTAVWTDWSEWSACTVSCREGVQQRRRLCYGKGRCRGDERLQTRPCTEQECCAVNGGWSAWTPWSSCSVTCATGQQERHRSCSQPPPSCGGECPGNLLEVKPCHTQQICPTHGSWSPWGPWAACQESCQQEGSEFIPIRRRTRVCSSPAPSNVPPGKPCPGDNAGTSQCEQLPFCPVAGNWGAWSALSPCSTSCGVGKIRQGRKCDHPAPKHGGAPCFGSAIDTVPCNTKIPCPVDGTWTDWSSWSECARSKYNISCRKYVGSQRRTRKCVGVDHDGHSCPGSIIDMRACYNNEECWYGKGTWTEWNTWSLCQPPCGSDSRRSRIRSCIPIYPNYPNESGVQKKVPVFFWGFPFYSCDELLGEQWEVQVHRPCYNVPLCN